MKGSIRQLNWRYATKKFDSNRVLNEKQVQLLKEAFNLTATSYGLQPVKMVVLQNKEIQQKLVQHSYAQEQVTQASHVLILCIEKEINASYIATYFERVKRIRGTSEDILAPFKNSLTASFMEKAQKEINGWAMNQAYLIMGNLLTICALEEIDACPMEGFEPAAYDELLGLNEKGLSSVLVLPVGYRAPDDPFSSFKKVRKTLNESIIEIN